jgi:hypothetical protein
MRIFRFVIFLTFSLYIVVGPFFSQVLGYDSKIFRKWVMFTDAGKNIIEVNFYLRNEGVETKIDIFTILGYNSRQDAPRSLKRIKSKKEAMRVAKRLCGKFRFKKDVRMYGRRGSRSHWIVFADGKRNICESIKKKK